MLLLSCNTIKLTGLYLYNLIINLHPIWRLTITCSSYCLKAGNLCITSSSYCLKIGISRKEPWWPIKQNHFRVINLLNVINRSTMLAMWTTYDYMSSPSHQNTSKWSYKLSHKNLVALNFWFLLLFFSS